MAGGRKERPEQRLLLALEISLCFPTGVPQAWASRPTRASKFGDLGEAQQYIL